MFTSASNTVYTDNLDRKSFKGYIFSLFSGPIN
jgi:hypothetical protein